jgi:hypothetical protein
VQPTRGDAVPHVPAEWQQLLLLIEKGHMPLLSIRDGNDSGLNWINQKFDL